jgi:hypothetical protein
VSPASLAYAQGAGRLLYRGHDLEATYGLVAADLKVILRHSYGADIIGDGGDVYMGYVMGADVFVHACEGVAGEDHECSIICTFTASDAGQASVGDFAICDGGFYADGNYNNLHAHFRGVLIDLETY